ncbi:hypothetical protein NPIL_120731 [Nephila pilipes]|uniref:Uncharacterized protein n=1 Tax=Nephila pilipes TaxID=299642 RepID=A0A8X6QEU8_NEPPI|nr:hypothetical protein NPIL_120731 [Nephila pilipes]
MTSISFAPVKLAFRTVVPDGCDETKAPIIFIHGLTASKEYWMDIPEIVANATKRKVSAYNAMAPNIEGKPGSGSPGEEAKKRRDIMSFLNGLPSSQRAIITNVDEISDHIKLK